MVKPRFDILRLFNPATDFPAIIAVLLGLSIAIFLNEIAIKLIGACVGILGGVALFMLFSQRLKDTSFLSAPKPVSEPTAFKTTIRQDTSTKRLIFDDYAESFGKDEFSGKEKTAADKDAARPQYADFSSEKSSSEKFSDEKFSDEKFDAVDEGFTIIPKTGRSDEPRPAQQPPKPTVQPDKTVALDKNSIEDFSDGSSSMRIIGSVKKTEQPANVKKAEPAKKVEPVKKAEPAKAAPQKQEPQKQAPPAPVVQEKKPEKKAPVAPPVATKEPAAATTAPTATPAVASAPEVVVPKTEKPAVSKPAPAQQVQQPVVAEEQLVSGHKRKALNIQLADIIEETPNSIKNEPRKEFDFLISRVLMVIRSVISARTTLFFWVNFDKEELVLESKISDKPEALNTQRKIPLANDVISHIALTGTPEILTEINPSAEIDLLPYYQESAATRSFVGVPVYFNNNVVGILTADTTEEDAYDSMTVGFLGHFTKLISGLIQGYTEKYDLLQSARTLEVVDTFRRLVNNQGVTKEDVCTALMESLDGLISYSSMGICIYSEETDRWYIAQMRSKNNENYTGQEVHLETTLVGKTIVSGKTSIYDSTSMPKNTRRLTAVEKPLNGNIATFVPLKSPSRCYGAIFAETPANTPLTQQDLEIIEVLAEYAGSTLEHKHLDTMLHSNALTDETTGISNSVAFLNRVQEEFYRVSDLHTPFALCLVNIDQYATLHTGTGAEFTETIAQHIVEHIERHLRPYDIIGRVDANILGAGLIHKNAREAQLWAERLRGDIASSILQYGGRQFSVTVSIGIVECTVQKSFDELLSNAEQALQTASRKTNSVSLYA